MKKTYFVLYNLHNGCQFAFLDSLLNVEDVCRMLEPYTGVSVRYEDLLAHARKTSFKTSFRYECIEVAMRTRDIHECE